MQERDESQNGGTASALRHTAIAWVLPFAVFMLLLGIMPHLRLPATLDLVIRVLLPALALVLVSRPVLDFRVASWFGSIAIGVLVFVIWVGPDLLFPGYRQHWLFQNSITGQLTSSLTDDARADGLALFLRISRAVCVVPIVEELFWRGWLMRWIIRHDFQSVRLGTYAHGAFWITAVLFAAEHGPYWEVGFLAGAIYNWWIVRMKRLGDLFLAHAVTNGCLAAFVLVTGRWEYWM